MHPLRLPFLILSLASTALAGDEELFSFIPSSPGGQLKHSTTYTESGSSWAPGLDEKKVFLHQLSWGDKDKGWQIRIGHGGQIYSLVGPFGEAMPPQVHQGSEWNDEVWQLVSVCPAKNDATLVKIDGKRKRPLAYFIHGSGIYKRDPQLKDTFYNPVLAENSTPSSYAILNWGQHAHVPTVHRSDALYYTRLNLLDDGTIALNYSIHNFGDAPLSYFNTPWGGVRHSTLPVHILSRPDGSFGPTEWVPFSGKGITNADQTGGWSGFFTENSPEAWGIALVFGHSKEQQRNAKVRYRWGYAGGKKNPRDYFVSVVNPRLPVEKNQTLNVRIFVIIDQLKNIGRRAAALSGKTRYQVSQFQQSPKRTIHCDSENYRGKLELSAWPVVGSRPLFLVRQNKTGKTFVTDDLYRFASRDDFSKYHPDYRGSDPVLRPYDGNTEYLKLLGFAGPDLKLNQEDSIPEKTRRPHPQSSHH